MWDETYNYFPVMVKKTFDKSFGTTLNLNDLQKKIDIIKKWYEDKGYSLARISGPERISSNGIVSLKFDEGVISNINLRFIGTDEEVRKGKTKDWVIRRELKTSPGIVFNRKTLETDIKRLYATVIITFLIYYQNQIIIYVYWLALDNWLSGLKRQS